MIGHDDVAELLEEYVLVDGENVEQLEDTPDGIRATTDKRRFVVRSERDDWLVGRETWVEDFVVITREDLHVHGQSERFGFLLVHEGAAVSPDGLELFVNDADVVAELGMHLGESIDPLSYAELVVQFHPYSSARRVVLVEPDDLRRVFGLEELPDVEPFRTEYSSEGTVASFTSCAVYRPPGSVPLLDLYDWTIWSDGGDGAGATWESTLAERGIPLVSTRS